MQKGEIEFEGMVPLQGASRRKLMIMSAVCTLVTLHSYKNNKKKHFIASAT